MNAYPLRLERYLFPVQEVRANPAHDPSKGLHGSHVRSDVHVAQVDEQPRRIVVEVSVCLDEAASDNPPYFFNITAFGVFIAEESATYDAAASLASLHGPQVLIGAIREHLALLTSRAPWGPFVLNIVPLHISTEPDVRH